MSTNIAIKEKTVKIEESLQRRTELLDKLIQRHPVFEHFLIRHDKELVPVAHTKDECALPGYMSHTHDTPRNDRRGFVSMHCGVKHQDLIRMVEMGDTNPLFIYSLLENGIADLYPHVKMTLLRGHGGTGSGKWKDKGSGGDVLFFLEPYGPRASELESHLEKTLPNGQPAFKFGKCVGFAKAAIGLIEREDPILYIDVIQTDGNRKCQIMEDPPKTGEVIYEHSLPGGLRKIYMDGKKPNVKAWYHELLTAIEDGCSTIGLPIAIPTWEEVIKYAELPTISDSESIRMIYLGPFVRGYGTRKVHLTFPQRETGIKERYVNVWTKG